MAQKKNEFLLDAEFRCQGCASIIGVRVPLAAVKSTGWEVTCGNCRRTYLVTEEGAVPTDGKPISGSIHHGHLAWDKNTTHTPQDFEPGGSQPAVNWGGARPDISTDD